MSKCDCQESIEDEAPTLNKEPMTFTNGLLITTIISTAAVLLFGLWALGTGQQGTLLTSTSLVPFIFLLAIF